MLETESESEEDHDRAYDDDDESVTISLATREQVTRKFSSKNQSKCVSTTTFNEEQEKVALEAREKTAINLKEKLTKEFQQVKASKPFNTMINNRLEHVQRATMFTAQESIYK